jgi:pilus assembly protein CpaC
MKNLDNIITIVKSTYPNLIIQQANDTIILKGHVKNYREKDTVIDIFKKAGVEIENQLVDMIETSSPSKMIKIKLYAVEINNDEGMDIKNTIFQLMEVYMIQ